MKKENPLKKVAIKERSILGGFGTQKKTADGQLVVSLRWFRILGVLLTLFVTAWFSTAGALYFWFKHKKDFEDVKYTGMIALPFRLDEHRKEMGDFHVEKGIDYFNKGAYRESLSFLRIGVLRSPGNLQGRLLLTQFYEQVLKRVDVAQGLLVGGLEHGGSDDLDYLKSTIRFLLKHQLDEEIQLIADTYLPKEATLSDINRVIAFGAAQANYLRGNYDRADDYVSAYELNVSIEGTILSAQIMWNRGQEEAALSRLKKSLEQFQNNERLLLQLSRFYRDQDNLDEARKYAIMRNLMNPLSAGPRIELLYIYNKSGDSDREERETKRIFKQFKDEEEALLSITNFAADIGNVSLAQRAYESALENEFNVDLFALLLIESHLVSKDFQGALNFSEELEKEQPSWLNDRRHIFNSLRSVASYGVNRPDFGDIYLNEFLRANSITADQYYAVSKRLISINHHKEARKVLMAAHKISPSNQKVLAELIKTELTLGYTEELNNLLKRFLAMRRPQIEIIETAYKNLGSDRFIFTANREDLLIDLQTHIRDTEQEDVVEQIPAKQS